MGFFWPQVPGNRRKFSYFCIIKSWFHTAYKKLELIRLSKFNLVGYCEILKIEFSKILDFLRWLKIRPKDSTLQLGYSTRKPNLWVFWVFAENFSIPTEFNPSTFYYKVYLQSLCLESVPTLEYNIWCL